MCSQLGGSSQPTREERGGGAEKKTDKCYRPSVLWYEECSLWFQKQSLGGRCTLLFDLFMVCSQLTGKTNYLWLPLYCNTKFKFNDKALV